jgi:hypothetical protein
MYVINEYLTALLATSSMPHVGFACNNLLILNDMLACKIKVFSKKPDFIATISQIYF